MDDNLFECPNCGARIYPEMTRCPECGQNMYPDDEEITSTVSEARQPAWIPTLGALVIGWMITSGIPLLLHFIVAAFNPPDALGGFGVAVLFLSGPVGALVGSYVASGIARQPAKWIGVVVAGLSLPLLVLYATHWVQVTWNFLLSPVVLIDGILTVLAGLFGGWLNYKLTKDTGWKADWQARGREDWLYQDLLRKVRFNGSVADRLIEYERKENPQASRLQLIQSAIEHWDQDNR